MKGEITLRLLEFIRDAAVGAADLTAAFLESGYGASYGKIMYEFEQRSNQRVNGKELKIDKKIFQQRFYNMLYKLKKDGLIEEAVKSQKSFLKITLKGKQRINRLKERQIDLLPDSSYQKTNSKNDKFTIVVFDIPERDRRKRSWLRIALKNLDFNMIQQSVWAGKVKIPEEFINDLKELRLIEYVEIFEISKSGSLRQLTS